MKKITALAIIGTTLYLNLLATNYHVDGQHQGAESGSLENPFTTIKQAADIMVAGDTCFIHEGIYRETINPVNSGSSGNPIVFTAFNNERVVVSAADTLSGWVEHSGNIYKTTNASLGLGTENNIFHESKKMQLARWPNNNDWNEYTLDAKYISTNSGSYSDSYISNSQIPNIDWTGGVIHYLGAHSGCSWQKTIRNFDNSSKRVYFDQLPDKWPFSTHSPNRNENGHRGIFYLMNKLEALDAPGEWYWDNSNGTLYFYSPSGNDPNDEYVEFSARERTLQLSRNYNYFENINFFGGQIYITGKNNKITNCRIKYAPEKIIADNTSATDWDAAIMFVDADFNTIEKCILEEGTTNAIMMNNTSSDNLIQNCVIKNFNKVGLHACLIRSSGERNKFLHNTMSGSARDGVYITGEDSEFGYNKVSSCLLSGADGGLFYVTGSSIPKNIEVHHNWFWDAWAADHAGKKAAGIYLDNNSAGYIVHHNVVWDVEWGGLHFNWDAIENEIYNNTFWDVGPSDQSVIDCWVPIRDGVRTNVRDNILYNNLSDVREWWHSGDGNFRVDGNEVLDNDFKNNMQSASNIFEDFDNQNFVPIAGSNVIDNGLVVSGITDGFAGTAPDVGAYETGVEAWVPGVDYLYSDFLWKWDVSDTAASIHFDDTTKYLNSSYQINNDLTVKVLYDAGKGYKVTDEFGGIQASLIEMDKDSSLVNEYKYSDSSAVNYASGLATVVIPLANIIPSDELPEGSFYELRASFVSTNGETYSQSISPINIVKNNSSTNPVDKGAFKIFPNPATSYLNVETKGDLINKNIEIFDANGRLLIREELEFNQQQINIDHLKGGVYYLRVLGKDQIGTTKFLKND